MQIIPDERRVVMSVGAFAGFGSASVHRAGAAGAWRMETGRVWHEEMQQRSEKRYGDAVKFEEPIEGIISFQNWKIELSGRIDQLLTTDTGIEIFEVKSTRHPIPDTPEILQQKYPHYFNQAAAYALLWAFKNGREAIPVSTKLVFVNIDDGISQTCEIERPEQWIKAQCERLLPFLEARSSARNRCVSITFNPPFETLRDGQAEARAALHDARPDTQHRIFQAPTGFGKTGIALEYALTCLQRGEVERIVYLTSKTSGQHQACKQLAAMLTDCEDPPLTLQLRNREDHHRGLANIPEPNEDAEAWAEIVSEIPGQFREGFFSLDAIRAFAEDHDVDPFEITRRAIAFADILVADYNYVFSPAVRGFLENSLGWRPDKTFLIVDEVHNLPSRGCMVWSQELNKAGIEQLRDYLFFNSLHPKLQRDLDELTACLSSFKESRELSQTEAYELKNALSIVKNQIQSTPLPWDEFSDDISETLNTIMFAHRTWEYSGLPYLIYAGRDQSVSWRCLDASSELGLSLDSFAGTLNMSATIGQPDIAAESFGIAQHLAALQWIEAEAPWRREGYQVAIDTRVDTRLKARERSYQTTAETIAAMADRSTEAVVAFFPSYRYAEAIQTYLETLFPHLRLTLQERGLNFDEQEGFLLRALGGTDVLLLILGSSFSEGIDVLGGRIESAIVVGPALPEMSDTQEALRQRHEQSMSSSEAFERTYIVPGMQKINQALGRLVRSPEHRARVILHGKRFAETAYQKHLDPIFIEDAETIVRREKLLSLLLTDLHNQVSDRDHSVERADEF